MASLPAASDARLLKAEEFFEIDFGPDLRAELDNGVIHMMVGGTRRHNRIRVNLLTAFRQRLRGSGCRPNGSDTAVRTHDLSVRYPDVSISCAPGLAADDARDIIDDPQVIVEILSPSTQRLDRGTKLNEYKAIGGVDAIVLVDPESERLHIFRRTGRHPDRWEKVIHTEPATLDLPTLGITVPHMEIFARD